MLSGQHQSLWKDWQLQIHYRNAKHVISQITVSPLALFSRDLNLYLVARIPSLSNLRALRMNRIPASKVQEAPYERPVDFDIDAYIASEPFHLGATRANVHLRFFDHEGHALLDAPLAADQVILRQRDDGRLEIQATGECPRPSKHCCWATERRSKSWLPTDYARICGPRCGQTQADTERPEGFEQGGLCDLSTLWQDLRRPSLHESTLVGGTIPHCIGSAPTNRNATAAC